MLRDRWYCSTGHMGREDTNLWGNQYIEYREKNAIHAGACFVYGQQTPMHMCTDPYPSFVPGPYFNSDFKMEMRTGYKATSTPRHQHTHIHACIQHTHRPVFVEIQVVPLVLVVGRKRAEGQVALTHWTHGEGRHQPVGEPTGTIGRRED